MTGRDNLKHAANAATSTASLNGGAATLMSIDMGAAPASVVYASAALAGLINKYRVLKNGGDEAESGRDNFFLRILTDPSITPKIFMAAAVFNFALSAYDASTGAPEHLTGNLLRMGGWVCGFLGDNALRRLDAANYKKDATVAVEGSRLRETFNALTANPTLFYNGASIAFTMAMLSAGGEDILSTVKGGIALAAIALISVGTAYALKRTWDAAAGKIGTDKINDGVMNYCSSLSKGMQSAVSFMTGGHAALGCAQAIFTCSNIRVIFETRKALDKKPVPPAVSANP